MNTAKNTQASYAAEQLWTPLSESLLDWDEAFHDLMLNDRLRMKAYRKAIFEAVRPGDLVLDLGTGTGILSQWALEAGAARVIGIELSAPIMDMAVERMRHAGFAKQFQPINKYSYEVELPEQVDVLISEIIGNMADNEDFQPILEDAIRRFLKPGGTVLPLSTDSYLVPVAARRAHADLRDGVVASLSSRYEMAAFSRQRGMKSPFDIYYDCILPDNLYLSAPQQVCSYRGAWEQAATYTRHLSFSIDAEELLTGFKVYFVAALTPDTLLDISKGTIEDGATSDSWKHAYLPIEHPIQVNPGDCLEIAFSRSYPQGPVDFRQVYCWQGQVTRAGKVIGSFRQDMGNVVETSHP
jgi:protein arginine N-methyltransferase 1